MCGNQEKRCITFSIWKSAWGGYTSQCEFFQLTHVGWHHRNQQKQQIKLYENEYSWQISEGTFLCLLNFIRNSQAETVSHCSLTNQYNTSMHPLELLKVICVRIFLGACDPKVLKRAWNWAKENPVPPLNWCLLSTLSQRGQIFLMYLTTCSLSSWGSLHISAVLGGAPFTRCYGESSGQTWSTDPSSLLSKWSQPYTSDPD
jgi:hypothetical protein